MFFFLVTSKTAKQQIKILTIRNNMNANRFIPIKLYAYCIYILLFFIFICICNVLYNIVKVFNIVRLARAVRSSHFGIVTYEVAFIHVLRSLGAYKYIIHQLFDAVVLWKIVIGIYIKKKLCIPQPLM